MKRRGSAKAAHKYPRSARLNELIMEIVGDELERLSDPRLALVTVTGADANADLTRAVVYYSVIDDQGRTLDEAAAEATAVALERAAPHVRGSLGKQVRWRATPELLFRPDPAIEQGQRIEAILRDLHARDGRVAGDGEDDPLAD